MKIILNQVLVPIYEDTNNVAYPAKLHKKNENNLYKGILQ
jgi:hypothetical protein